MTRRPWLPATVLCAVAAALGSTVPARPVLIWNASPSVPVGLYAVYPAGVISPGDLVAVTPPATLARFMADRRYLALGVPLLKHVAALAGQRICRTGRAIWIDGRNAGDALDRDRRGRPLPRWIGCFEVPTRHIFLMNAARYSFDSRYFGALATSGVLGRASPLWTRATS